MKNFSEIMKYLPHNLQQLNLNLSINNLGDNSENMKFLRDGIKQLPNSLQNIQLKINHNNLGVTIDNMKYLA